MSKNLLRGFMVVFLMVFCAGVVWAADIDYKGLKTTAHNADKYPIAVPVDSDKPVTQSNISTVEAVTSPGVVGTSDFSFATAYYGRNIAVGPDGVIHVVWSLTGTPTNETRYSHSTDGGETWSPYVVVNDGYYGYKPAIAVDPNDGSRVFVAYVGYQQSGETRAVRMARSIDGGATFEASIPADPTAANTNNPDIIVDQDGNPHVAFDSYSDTVLRYNYSADGGVTWWPFAEAANLGFGKETFSASVQIDKNGNPHVMFGGGGATGSWGDKATMWSWRDMAIGLWEVPPVEIAPAGTGTPYPTMVFDSQNIGHCVYDNVGTAAGRAVFYTTLTDGSWGEAIEFPGIDGGYSMEPSIGIDANDVLYVCYLDGLGESAALDPCDSDLFTGTNISGEWQFVNLTADGKAVCQSYPDVARVVLDGTMHVVFTQGCGAPFEIVHKVGYPWPPEPTCGVSVLSDTYNTTGPFKVTAGTGDIDGNVVGATLKVWLNQTLVHEIDMTMVETDHYQAEFTVEEGAVGDTVKYQGISTDNDGLTGESSVMSFEILQPNQPYADLLIVLHDSRMPNQFPDILDAMEYVYEVWDIDEHAGIDESVTNFGWGSIFVSGWAVSTVPTRTYEGDPYAAFLDAGSEEIPHNLFVGSMDYLWANGEPDEPVFEPGDFAYDYFQIGEGVSDPDSDPTTAGYQTGIDSLFLGDTDSPISFSWAETPLETKNTIGDYADYLCPDWIYATGDGYECFFAYNQGLTSGIHYDAGTFKTINLTFAIETLMDTTETGEFIPGADDTQLIKNIIAWFGTDKGVPSSVDIPHAKVVDSYNLHQNYPNPFNPETRIVFDMPKNGEVKLTIYNAIGQQVRTLVDKRLVAGSHVEVWDGTDNKGVTVPSGVYFYTVKMGDYSRTLKMALMR